MNLKLPTIAGALAPAALTDCCGPRPSGVRGWQATSFRSRPMADLQGPKIAAEKRPFARRERSGSFRVAVDYHERTDRERDMNRLGEPKNNENERLVAGRYWVVRDPVEASEPTYWAPFIANEDEVQVDILVP